jgi:hypothetical protein
MATTKEIVVGIRFHRSTIDQIDAHCERMAQEAAPGVIHPSRSDAIRNLISLGLEAAAIRKPKK